MCKCYVHNIMQLKVLHNEAYMFFTFYITDIYSTHYSSNHSLVHIFYYLKTIRWIGGVTSTPTPSTDPPIPGGGQHWKQWNFNTSWTNQYNLILLEDFLPLNTPKLIDSYWSCQIPPVELLTPWNQRRPNQ